MLPFVAISARSVIFALLFCVRTANAAPQPEDVQHQARAGAIGEQARDTYINDSFEAADLASQATELAANGGWHEASELIQKGLRELDDKIIRLPDGRYIGVGIYLNRVLASWPREGLDAYRAAAEPELRAGLIAIEGSREIEDYLPLFQEFFCTNLILEVADILAGLAIERGDLALARSVLQDLLESHPGSAEVADRFRGLLAVVQAISGDPVPPVSDQVRIRWKGEERALVDVLAEVKEDFKEFRKPISASEWPIFGGEPKRNRLLTPDVTEPGLLWRFLLVPSPQTSDENGLDLVNRATRESARRLTALPIAAGDFLYVQFERQILALHRHTGAIAWRFESEAAVEPDSFLDDQPPGWNSPTISGDRLFAALPTEESTLYDSDTDRNGAELVCLNARTGELLWSADAACFGIKPAELVLDSSPLVAEDHVYLVARRRRSFGFEDCYLYSLSARNGAVRFRVHLGGASTATFGSRTVTVSIPALHDGTIYVSSGLGSVAAVSAYTGAVKWLRTYERLREADNGVPGIAARDLLPWQFNPIIYADNRLIALPTDSKSVLIFSADGALEAAVPRESIGGMQTLLGLREGQVCGVGEGVACFDLDDPSRQWAVDLPLDHDLFGRATMTGDAIWVPTRKALLRYVPDSQRHSEFAWQRHADGGNLLVTPNAIIVAEPMAIAAYGERERIWGALRERIAAAPDDPLPPLEFAEVAFGAGQLDEAAQAISLADQRLGGNPSGDWESVRRRLFNDAMSFANGLSSNREHVPTIEALFGIASRHAWDRESNVQYRLHFADIFADLGNPGRAASLYQQLLRDRGLRQYAADASDKSAGETAELRIEALLRHFGRSVYAEIESQGKDALSAAWASQDSEGIAEVVRTFPNSEAATKALVLLGDLQLAKGDFAAASRAYVRAFHRGGPEENRADLIAKLAELCQNSGQLSRAFLWLSKGVLQFPAATVRQNGRKRTLAELAGRLIKDSPSAAAFEPRLRLPLREPQRRSLDPGVKLLTPMFADASSRQATAYFLGAPRSIHAYSADSTKPLWPNPASSPAAAELLVQLDGVVLFATQHRVYSLDLAAGSTVWSVGTEPAHVADPGGDWEQGGAIRGHALEDNVLVTARDNGLFTAIDIRNGKVKWSRTLPAPAGPLRLARPWLIYHTSEEDVHRIHVLESETGELWGSMATEARRPIEDLRANFDGLALAMTSKSIECYELETRRRKWSVPLTGQLQSESLAITPDGVVYADSDRELVKLAMDDGRVLWRSAPIADQAIDGARVRLVEEELLVFTPASVAAIDVASGITLWTGVAPDEPRFVQQLITEDFAAAIHSPRSESEPPMVYFYQLRSGRIPAHGGTLELESASPIQTALVIDGALLVQTADELLTYASGD